MGWEQVVANFGGGGVAVAAALTALRSKKVRAVLSRLLTDTNRFEGPLDSLRLVVEAQGESIEWLRSELDVTRVELSKARQRLNDTEGFVEENAKLRARVFELELHVARLEGELRSYKLLNNSVEVTDL